MVEKRVAIAEGCTMGGARGVAYDRAAPCPRCGGRRRVEIGTDGHGRLRETVEDCRACVRREVVARLSRPAQASPLASTLRTYQAERPRRVQCRDQSAPETQAVLGGVRLKKFGTRTYFARNGAGAMVDKGGQLGRLIEALMSGLGVRAAAQAAGCSQMTARKCRRLLIEVVGPILCPCGKDSTHQGWCSVRLASRQAGSLAP